VSRLRGVPAGRAGRTWLVERLRVAERGVELLDGKLRVLQREQRRYRLRCEHTAAAWAAACRDAETWALRAAVLGGRRAARFATPAEPVDVAVTWTVVMGVRHPAMAQVRGGEPAVTDAGPSNTALARAGTATRQALAAAAEHAVVLAAVRRLDAEVLATRRRLRAVQDRWIPLLTEALHQVEQDLEDLEQAEGSRLRWAAARTEVVR
jgi:V/A-type H+-transporting ATPase subunit D